MNEAPPLVQPDYSPSMAPILNSYYYDWLHYTYRYDYDRYYNRYIPNFNTPIVAANNSFDYPVPSSTSPSTFDYSVSSSTSPLTEATEFTAIAPNECNYFEKQHDEYYQTQSSSNSPSNYETRIFYQTYPSMSHNYSLNAVNMNEVSEFRPAKLSPINRLDRRSCDDILHDFGTESSANGLIDAPVVGHYPWQSASNSYSNGVSNVISNVEVKEPNELQSSTNNRSEGVSHARYTKNAKEMIKCEPCNRIFKTWGYLKQHNNARHTPSRVHKCKKCSKGYLTEADLAAHSAKHNSGQKKFMCDGCVKSFYYHSDLRRHMRLHTKNLYTCITCDKGFTRMGHLESHQKVHLKKKK